MQQRNVAGFTAILFTVLSVGAMLPAAVSAQVTASLGVANMYLWRGQNLTPDGGQVHGGVRYDNGPFYAGMWTTSEQGGHETDLYLGIRGTAGEFGYDLSWVEYLYPENGTAPNDGLSDTDTSELILSASYSLFTATAYINTDSDTGDDNYFTIAADIDRWNLTFGFWDLENPGSGTAGADEYSHITVKYALTDALTTGVSVAMSDLDVGAANGVEEDPLFLIAYDWSFDVK